MPIAGVTRRRLRELSRRECAMSTSTNPQSAGTLTIPSTLRLEALSEGPQEGWSWDDSREIAVRVAEGPFRWAEPVGLAMFSAWAKRRQMLGLGVRIDDSLKSPSAWKLGLLLALAGRPQSGGLPNHIPPCSFTSESHMSGRIDELVEGLAIHDAATESAVQHAVEDLCRNVFDHASTNGQGAHIAASYEPSTGRVRIGVADCGKGIARDMQETYGSELSDLQAVRMAIEPEVSGSKQPGSNRGVGLYVARRLALAARGAFWVRTSGIQATASSLSPEDSAPHLREMPSRWEGTAVAVTFLVDKIKDYRRTMDAIRDDIEGRGPHFAEMKFFTRAEDRAGWERVSVPPDVGKMALERERALALGKERILPALSVGSNVILDFTNTKTATQAFCHALVVPICMSYGPSVLSRLYFVACSSQVEAMVRTGLHYALREHSGHESR